MRKRFISLLMTLCMTVSLLPMSVISAAAEESTYGFGTNVLQNPEPTSNNFWERTGCSYGKFLDMGKNEPYIIGSKNGGDIAVRQQVTLTAADAVRANKGDLTVEASGKFYAQGSRTLTANLNIICYDATGAVKKTYNDKDRGYSVTGRTKTLKVAKSQIPAGTAYIVYEGTEHLGSGGAYFGMYDFSMIFRDQTAPKLNTAPYLYAVNGSTAMPSYTVPGDKVTYAMRFDEAVTVSSNPTLDLSTVNGIKYDITYSSDRQTVYFTTTLKNTGNNTNLNLKNISGLTVKDDAGNAFNYSKSNLSVGNLSYKSVFDVTSNLTNLRFSGASTAKHGSDYTASLTPASGYKLPETVSVKVNGASVSGYTYDKSRGQVKISAAVITGNIEIAASGVPQTYTVTFDMQGGNGGTKSVSVTYLQAMPVVTPPSKTGYTFGGYFTAINGGVKYYNYDGKATKNYDKASDLTLYASWSAKNYTVTLDAAGGTGGGTVTAEYDADMPAITKPAKKGYTFLGYFTQQNGGGEKYYNADGTSAKQYDKTDGLMLYANWSANTYTVTFDMQGGNGGTDSTDVTYDAKMPSVTPPARTGYTFGGYFESANGVGTQYYYANGEAVKPYDIDASCTMYAKWTANTYDVVLNTQGGSGGSTVTAVYDSNMPVIAAPDKPGYIFGGYFESPNGVGAKYYNADCSSASVYNRAEGMTLYALWTPITYNIQLYSRGENVGTLQNVVYGELRLPSDTALGITYPNYNFMGWNMYDEQNWAMYTADRTYTAGLVTEQGKTAYMYAAWLEKDKYTVTYDANGGEGAPPAAEVHVNETIRLSTTVPSRQNYTFAGWSENSDSVTAQYQPNDSFTMGNSIVTLFAIWNKNPELVYNANGGVFSTYAGASYPAAGSSVTLTDAVPQKDGYVFRGWAESQTATAADIISSPYTMLDRDMILYAVYEPVLYTVSAFTADGYSVSGINAGGYTIGDYAEFTVSGTAPKVYVNGILVQPINGKYKIEIQSNVSIVVSGESGVNVIYNANGGINPPIDMRTYTNGDTASVKSDLPMRTGYTFSGCL